MDDAQPPEDDVDEQMQIRAEFEQLQREYRTMEAMKKVRSGECSLLDLGMSGRPFRADCVAWLTGILRRNMYLECSIVLLRHEG